MRRGPPLNFVRRSVSESLALSEKPLAGNRHEATHLNVLGSHAWKAGASEMVR